MAIPMPLEQRIRESEFIGVIKVVAIVPTTAASLPLAERYKAFLQIASAQVVDTVKGPFQPGSIIIEFDNGLACPNVTYRVGSTYLVFLTRHDDGYYSTVNYYFGRYAVESGTVRGWGTSPPFEAPLDQVKRQIRAAEKR